jgi:hypothetical protein
MSSYSCSILATTQVLWCSKRWGTPLMTKYFHFIVQPDFWLEPTERPAVTKEEKAANAIAGYLRLHGEAKRKELERHLQEIGLAESLSAAEKLVTRALSLLQCTGKGHPNAAGDLQVSLRLRTFGHPYKRCPCRPKPRDRTIRTIWTIWTCPKCPKCPKRPIAFGRHGQPI